MFQLTEQDQRFLLRIARDSVQSHLLNEPPRLPEVPAGILTEPRGVFVSIHKHGALRGCIGNIHPAGALYQTAAECAVAAAVGELVCRLLLEKKKRRTALDVSGDCGLRV